MPHILDDLDSFHQLDPHGMWGYTIGFAEQCRKAWGIGLVSELPHSSHFRSILLTGLGGSAAGGDFIRCLMDAEGKVPMAVNRDYNVPCYLTKEDLVICASYSGNTEETLSAYSQAKERGASLFIISSGGELTDRAKKDGFPVIAVPGAQPPRTAMGFMAVPIIVALERLGLLAPQPYELVCQEIEKVAKEFRIENGFESNLAKQIASDCFEAMPVIYGLGPHLGVVANRWKCQIHENAKALAMANGFPEMNHNEILGWVNGGKQSVGKFSGILLADRNASSKMKARAKVTLDLIGNVCKFHEIETRGESLFARMFATASIGDFVSIFLARLYAVDPENIDSINHLKEALSHVS